MDRLTASVSGVNEPLTVSVTDSHAAATATAMITAAKANLTVGDEISVSLGYNDDNNRVFRGYVKNVEISTPPKIYTITASNEMIRAVDFFIVSSNPDSPITYNHIPAETLVGNVLGLAGINNYHGDSPGFTFGIRNPVEVNLVGSYDFAKSIADMLAWAIYADDNGKVWFKDRKPYPMGGDSSVATLTDSELTNVKYSVSDRDLRNRVVVYGAEGVYATAQASSPWLPNGFYKSVAFVSQYIDSNSIAQKAANYNLAKLNRLTYNCTASIIGNPLINCRNTVNIEKDIPGLTAEWYVYGIEHNWNRSGFLTNLQLRR